MLASTAATALTAAAAAKMREGNAPRNSWSYRFSSLKVWEQEGSVFRAPFPVPCCVCHKPTVFIDLDYEAAFCSEGCLQEFEGQLPRRGDNDAD